MMNQEQKFSQPVSTRAFRLEGPNLKFCDGNGAELIRFTELR